MSDTRPDLAAIKARAEAAHDKVARLCDGSERWTMRVPADESYDHDLVISRALDDIGTLLAYVERLTARGVTVRPTGETT